MTLASRRRLSVSFAVVSALPLTFVVALAGEPTASIKTEYLMTLYAPTEPPQVIDDTRIIVNVPSGGWVEGPRIKGKIMPPGGDWLKILPGGIRRLDVRLVIHTDDAQVIFVSYNGAIQCEKETFDRFVKGEVLKAGDCYFVTAPTFETKSEKYAWLNGVQAVGKMIEWKAGSHVTYDIFVVK